MKTALVAVLLCLLATEASAQTAQRVSVQGSGLYMMLAGEAFEGLEDGAGWEAQVRYNPSAFSIGAGFQSTSHDLENDDPQIDLNDFFAVKISGAFVEPRFVIDLGSNAYAPYASARFSMLRLNIASTDPQLDVDESVSGATINAGGGILVPLSSRANLDLGLTAGYTSFEDWEFEGESFEFGSGTNVVARLGLAIGVL